MKRKKQAFTLIETVVALVILAILSSTVMVVINRCVISAADSTLRMHAFEVAREKMENLLASSSVKETVEYGSSDKYPDVTWQTVVETFYEPLTNRMWVRAVCSAEYEDTQGSAQTVELAHWLTNVTKNQLMQIVQEQQSEEDFLTDEEIIETVQEAAEYADVDIDTIEKWIENGMIITEDGSFIKVNLEIYKHSDGKPTPQQKNLQIGAEEDMDQQYDSDEKDRTEKDSSEKVDPATGLTYKELENMDFDEILRLIKSRSK